MEEIQSKFNDRRTWDNNFVNDFANNALFEENRAETFSSEFITNLQAGQASWISSLPI